MSTTTNGSSPYPDRWYRNIIGVDPFCLDKSRLHQGPVGDPFCIHDAPMFGGTRDHVSFDVMGLIGLVHIVDMCVDIPKAHYSFRCDMEVS